MGQRTIHKCDLIIVGLGNPTEKFKLNRHNVGYMIVDFYATTKGFKNGYVDLKKPIPIKWNIIDGKTVVILKPQDYMNSSGISIGALKNETNISNENILVIHDDLDFSFGRFKVRSNGSSGGHNGIKSIIDTIGKDFNRLRIGIGRPNKEQTAYQYVLSDFDLYERNQFCPLFSLTTNIIDSFIKHGADKTMSDYNKETR